MTRWLVHHQDGRQAVIDGMDKCKDCDLCGGVGKADCDLYMDGLELWLRVSDGCAAKEDVEAMTKVQQVEPDHINDINWFGQAYTRMRRNKYPYKS